MNDRKRRLQILKKSIAVFGVSILLALSWGLHNLHNHEADPIAHHDCPVFKYELVINSALILAVFILAATFTLHKILTNKPRRPVSFVSPFMRNRSPPY